MSNPAGGRFVWRDLMSTDVEKAKAFYTELFGWTIRPMPVEGYGDYDMLFNGEHGLGGISPLDPDHGMPSHWISYITTPGTVDEACVLAAKLGATVGVEPMDIPGVGRFAVVIDPQGAVFSPYTASEEYAAQAPPEPAPGTPGSVAWNELLVDDVEAAVSFYSRLFGWERSVMDVGTGPYHVMSAGGTMVAGIMQKPADMPAAAWTIYFEAATALDDALARANGLGGQTVAEAMDVPSIGRLCWVMDPSGGVFAMMQSLVPATV